jgi:hypothetical protein
MKYKLLFVIFWLHIKNQILKYEGSILLFSHFWQLITSNIILFVFYFNFCWNFTRKKKVVWQVRLQDTTPYRDTCVPFHVICSYATTKYYMDHKSEHEFSSCESQTPNLKMRNYLKVLGLTFTYYGNVIEYWDTHSTCSLVMF